VCQVPPRELKWSCSSWADANEDANPRDRCGDKSGHQSGCFAIEPEGKALCNVESCLCLELDLFLLRLRTRLPAGRQIAALTSHQWKAELVPLFHITPQDAKPAQYREPGRLLDSRHVRYCKPGGYS
jgi:hypothetical protein